MTFGGEPLLCHETICLIHSTAKECNIPQRQLITNGYFSKNEQTIETVAQNLCNAGINGIMLSVDAFHQEYIPLRPVLHFAQAIIKNAPILRAHPAWLVNEQHDNEYNSKTHHLLKIFADMGIEISRGNNIAPSGSAVKYLSDYLPLPGEIDLSIPCGQNPYTARPDQIECVHIMPNGDMMHCAFKLGNIVTEDALDILDNYNPYANPATAALLNGGVETMLEYATKAGLNVDISDCRTACDVCRKIAQVGF